MSTKNDREANELTDAALDQIAGGGATVYVAAVVAAAQEEGDLSNIKPTKAELAKKVPILD